MKKSQEASLREREREKRETMMKEIAARYANLFSAQSMLSDGVK